MEFTNRELARFHRSSGIDVKNVLGYDTIEQRLDLLQQLFKQDSPQPDLCKVDTIWPGILARDLIDLRPYLGDELRAIDPELLRFFTVDGRVVALPFEVDIGVLYYRTDLLRKYGYRHPPATWEELGSMAWNIQQGERRAGNREFWGFAWEGNEGESLTCNALEWQMAEGGGSLVDNDRAIAADNEASRRAIERAAAWVGTISPPSIVEYDEEDAKDFWLTGNVAFLRSWLDVYQSTRQSSSPIRNRFDVAPLPSGSAGPRSVFGGMALGVSRHSRHPREAIEALRFLVSADVQHRRTRATGMVPTRVALLEDQSLLSDTPFRGEFGKRWRDGVFARPSTSAKVTYDLVSREYAHAVHLVLVHRASAAQALGNFQRELVRLTGLPVASGRTSQRPPGAVYQH